MKHLAICGRLFEMFTDGRMSVFFNALHHTSQYISTPNNVVGWLERALLRWLSGL